MLKEVIAATSQAQSMGSSADTMTNTSEHTGTDSVLYAGSSNPWDGNQCCERNPVSNNLTFPCTNADERFVGCQTTEVNPPRRDADGIKPATCEGSWD